MYDGDYDYEYDDDDDEEAVLYKVAIGDIELQHAALICVASLFFYICFALPG